MAASRREIREAIKKAKEEDKKKTIEERERLISEVERRPPIWDRSLILYRQKDVVDDMWVEVAAAMQKEKEQCKKMWKTLLDHFRELIQTLQHTASGSGIKDVPKVTWPYFHAMLFMKPILEHRSAASNVFDDHANCSTQATESSEFAEESLIEIHEEASLLCEVETGSSSPTEPPVESPIEPPAEPLVQQKATNRHKQMQKKGVKTARALVDETLLQQLKDVNGQLNAKRERLDIFGEYVSDLLKDVPVHKQTKCQYAILNIIKQFTENGDSECTEIVK